MNRKERLKVYISDNSINKNKSTNPLVHLKYRQLQELAIKLMLPANIKYKLLLALIIARTTSREDVVDAITQEFIGKRGKLNECRNETKHLTYYPPETPNCGNLSTEQSTDCGNLLAESIIVTTSRNEGETNYIAVTEENNHNKDSPDCSDFNEGNYILCNTHDTLNINQAQTDRSINNGNYVFNELDFSEFFTN